MPLHLKYGIIVCALLLGMTPGGRAQVIPPVESYQSRHPIESAREWVDIGSHHVARKELERILSRTRVSTEDRDVLSLLMHSAFDDRDYDEAYQWSSEFLAGYPADGERGTALFIQGVSAFQVRQVEDARVALTNFLNEERSHPDRGQAYFWRAMVYVEQGSWSAAETDLQEIENDPASAAIRDRALMGWGLSHERRGDYEKARNYFDRLISEYPQSSLVTDARIRLASIALRNARHEQSLAFLREANPETPRQVEESLLLRAEANFQSNNYSGAQSAYQELLSQSPEGPFARVAQYGLAWSKLRQGNYASAQREFDSISARRYDSLSYAAMYQSGVLSILQQNATGALSKFDTLTNVSPYDQYAERAYFQMGMIHYRNKRYREARRQFQLAARMFPQSASRPVSYRMLGEANMAISDFSNAQYAFSQVRRLASDRELLAPSMFKEGIALYHLGRFKTSAERLGEFLKQFSQSEFAAEGYVWRGEALYQDGRYAEAERSYSEALRLFPNNPKKADARYGIAWTLFEQKKFSQAADAFDKFADDFPNDGRNLEASLRKADCYFFMGQYDRATSLYSSLAAEKKSGRQVEYAAFQLAMSHIQRGDFQRGVEHLRSFLAKYPESMYAEVAQFNIGWTYFSNERYAEAVTELRAIPQQYPQSQLLPRVYFNMGDSYYNLKQYDSSRVYYQRVVREFPASPLVPDAMTGLQYTYEAEGRPAQAIAEIDTILANAPAGASQEELLLKKGDILFGQGDFGGAVLQYQRLLTMNPNPDILAKALYQIGRAYELENNPQQAMNYYEQVVTRFPEAENAPTAALALGIAQIKMKQYNLATQTLALFDQRYQQSPLATEAHYNLGVALSNTTDRNAAMEQFRKIIERDSTDIFAERSRLQLARVHMAKKEYRAALDTLEKVVTRRNDDLAAEALLAMGENFLLLKKNQDALQAYKDVYEQYTEFPLLVERAYMGAGECYERLRDKKQARQAYEKVVEIAVDPLIKKDAEERLRRLRRG